jgi:hypothetical protein
MHLGEKYPKLWYDRVHFALAARNTDSTFAAHLPAARLHVSTPPFGKTAALLPVMLSFVISREKAKGKA